MDVRRYTETLELINSRNMQDRYRKILHAAYMQLRLVSIAAVDFADAQGSSGSTSTWHADTSRQVMSSRPEYPAQAFAKAVGYMLQPEEQRPPLDQFMNGVINEGLVPEERTQLRARSFLYELAVFIKMMRGLVDPGHAIAGLEEELDRLDRCTNNAISVRDSLAHFDERVLSEARRKPVQMKPMNFGPDNMLLVGLQLDGNKFGAHVDGGEFVQVTIDSSTVTVCAAIFESVVELFPLASPKSQLPN